MRFFTKMLLLLAAASFMASCCGIDKTAGTVGDGHPDKPNVSVGKLDFYPEFESPSGLVSARNVYVWLPSDYSKGKKYSVVYMSDGQNLFDAEKMLKEAGWDDEHFVSKVFPGLAHVEDSWASRLEVPVLYLLGK